MVVDIGEVKRHIKPKADSTLRNMKKDDLIGYIRTLEHNYNVAVSFNENQAKYIESLGVLPKWIPVTERLPEYERPVLGWDADFLYSHIVNFVYGQFFDDIDMSAVKVTHWMPLPEPPKEVE